MPKLGVDFTLADGILANCLDCGHPFFDRKFKLAWIPATAPTNRTGKGFYTEIAIYACIKCGKPFDIREAKNQGPTKKKEGPTLQ